MIRPEWYIHPVPSFISKINVFVFFPRFAPSTRVQMNSAPVRAPSNPTKTFLTFTRPYSEKRVLVRNFEIAEPLGHSLGFPYFPKILGADVLQWAGTKNDANICRELHMLNNFDLTQTSIKLKKSKSTWTNNFEIWHKSGFETKVCTKSKVNQTKISNLFESLSWSSELVIDSCSTKRQIIISNERISAGKCTVEVFNWVRNQYQWRP